MNDKHNLPPGSLLTLTLIFLAGLIDGLDVTIVTVALPTMTNYFDVSVSNGSWIVFAYVVGLASFLLPLGKMSKNHRTKKFMIAGTALFGVSSLMCGLSNSFWMLVGFRLLQGIAAAMMSCVIPTMIVRMLPKDRKGLGMSVLGASSGIAFILGPALGGLIVGVATWHWIFFINVPICAIIILMALKHLPRDEVPDREKDPTLIGGLSAMVLIGSCLTILEDLGDPDMQQYGKAVCGVLILISLPILIWSIRRDSRRAIIAPQMLRNREYLLVAASFLLCTIVVAGAQYLLPYLLQDHWGMSPAESSLYLSLMSVAMVLMVLPVGKMCDRYGCKYPTVAAISFRSGFCIIMIILSVIGQNMVLLIMAMIVFGISHAFSGTAQPTRMIHHATPGYEDEATNLMLMVNYVASAMGCVLFALIFSLAANSSVTDPLDIDMMTGFTATMWFSLAIMAVALICTLAVRNKIVKAKD